MELPELCYAEGSQGETVIIKRGITGYFVTDQKEKPDMLNAKLGITAGQYEAMIVGSMFGWHVPAANPDNYDDEGNFKR